VSSRAIGFIYRHIIIDFMKPVYVIAHICTFACIARTGFGMAYTEKYETMKEKMTT
jgi:hypothetical protein